MLGIKRQDFLNLVKLFPEDFEKFYFIKDSLLIGE
jgi:hypothetical protein